MILLSVASPNKILGKSFDSKLRILLFDGFRTIEIVLNALFDSLRDFGMGFGENNYIATHNPSANFLGEQQQRASSARARAPALVRRDGRPGERHDDQ